jgi:hypothetical protein
LTVDLVYRVAFEKSYLLGASIVHEFVAVVDCTLALQCHRRAPVVVATHCYLSCNMHKLKVESKQIIQSMQNTHEFDPAILVAVARDMRPPLLLRLWSFVSLAYVESASLTRYFLILTIERLFCCQFASASHI